MVLPLTASVIFGGSSIALWFPHSHENHLKTQKKKKKKKDRAEQRQCHTIPVVPVVTQMVLTLGWVRGRSCSLTSACGEIGQANRCRRPLLPDLTRSDMWGALQA